VCWSIGAADVQIALFKYLIGAYRQAGRDGNLVPPFSKGALVTSGIVAITMPESGDELCRLAAWLREEDEFRGRVQLTDGPPRPGQFGSAVDSVMVGVTSGTATAFCTSFFGWLSRRKQQGKVSLKIKRSGDTQELDLACASAADTQDVLVSVREFLSV
jgi:hypothetical protein